MRWPARPSNCRLAARRRVASTPPVCTAPLRARDEIGAADNTESPCDRHVTLRGLARVLAKHFELRLFRATYQSDTHVFYVRPAWWWNEAERRRGDAIARLFRPTDETLEFP